MPKRTTDYRPALLEDLKDPAEAAHYLNAALQESEEMFLVALRDVAEARQMAKVAHSAGVSRESIYRMLSPSGNPTYKNLIGILKAIDIEFSEVRSRSARQVRRGAGPASAKRPIRQGSAGTAEQNRPPHKDFKQSEAPVLLFSRLAQPSNTVPEARPASTQSPTPDRR